MQVHISPDLEARFNELALQSGRLVSYDEWVIQEVEKGLAAADRGEFVEHEEVRKLIDLRYPANSMDGTGGPRPHDYMRLHNPT